MGRTAGVRFSAGASFLSLFHNFKPGTGAHPASYAMDAGVKSPGREADV
jgi:hypothetical protein